MHTARPGPVGHASVSDMAPRTRRTSQYVAAGFVASVVVAAGASLWLASRGPGAPPSLPLRLHAAAAPPPIAPSQGAQMPLVASIDGGGVNGLMTSALSIQSNAQRTLAAARRYRRPVALHLTLPADTLLVATQRLSSPQIVQDLMQAAQHGRVWVMLGRNAQDARVMSQLERAGVRVRYTPRRFTQYPTIIYVAAAQYATVSADSLDPRAPQMGPTLGVQGAAAQVIEGVFVADWYRRPVSQVVSPALVRRANIAVGPWQHVWQFPVTQANRGGQVTIDAPSLTPLVLQLWRQWDSRAHWHVPVQIVASSNVLAQTAQRLLGVTQVQTLRAPAPQAGLVIMAPDVVVGWAQTSAQVGPHVRWIGAWVKPF